MLRQMTGLVLALIMMFVALGWRGNGQAMQPVDDESVVNCITYDEAMQLYGDESVVWVNTFDDIFPNDEYYDSVAFVNSRNLLEGMYSDSFAPKERLTRGMLVVMLARLAGADVSGYTSSSFSDVGSHEYYANAVEWAYANGIIKGHEDGTFRGTELVSRQSIATLLVRLADSTGKDLPRIRNYINFIDDRQIDDYAAESVRRLYQSGIVNGRHQYNFDPTDSATRAEVAQMLHRFLTVELNNSTE